MTFEQKNIINTNKDALVNIKLKIIVEYILYYIVFEKNCIYIHPNQNLFAKM